MTKTPPHAKPVRKKRAVAIAAPDKESVVTSRHEELFVVAADIFWSKGYHATSMNDIAGAMQMRKASLYHHIDSKETLLFEMSVSSLQHMIDMVSHVTSVDPEERLRDIIVGHVQTMLADRSRHATALIELRSLPAGQRDQIVQLRGAYDKLIDRAVRAVQKKTGRWQGLSTRLVRMGLLGMLNWSVFWFSADGRETPETVGKAFYAILMNRGESSGNL